MTRPVSIPDFRFPFSAGLLRLVARGFGLGPDHRVLDLCTGEGAAALLLAHEFGCRVTGLDSSESRLRTARSIAQSLGQTDRVEFRTMDLRHLELPSAAYDVILALGGALTTMGQIRALEQIGVHLVPGGHLLISDLVYLDSRAPAVASTLLREVKGLDEEEVVLRENRPEPIVRAILERGEFAYQTESDHRELLEALGYEVELSLLSPESEWAGYFDRTAREAGEKDSPHHDIEARALVAQEAAAFYGYGGRASVGYLLIGARRDSGEGHD